MTAHNWSERAKMMDLRIRNFIDGEYINSGLFDKTDPAFSRSDCITKHSPRDGSLLYKFGYGDAAEIDVAVASARQAFNDCRWQGLPVTQRKVVLHRLASLLEEHKEEFALYESLDVGKPIYSALTDDIPEAVRVIRSSAEGADKLVAAFVADVNDCTYQVRKPVGVVGGIIGWNYPLTLAAQKVGPALAMGNSLVLKPSEFTSLSACRLAELALQAGVPAGVFNVVHGAGVTVGASLALHQDVDLLTFTGSSATGKQMMIAAGQSNMKGLILECGGKSPYLVFDDCPNDLDSVAKHIVARAFANQGALCIAGTRLLVQHSLKERLLAKIVEQAANIVPADPLDPQTRFGAIINKAHMDKVLSYIESGQQEGAELIYGGQRVRMDTGGYYLQPTIFDNVDPQHKIAKEEIFGPVLSVFEFQGEEQAIRLANDSCFGLAAYVSTQSLSRAKRLAARLNAGLMHIIGSSKFVENDIDINIEPHRQSGVGTEGGLSGLAAYTVNTAVRILA